MNRDDIIRMAEIACNGKQLEYFNGWGVVFNHNQLERFAHLVAAAERERIIAANAPEIEKVNVYIKALEDAVAAEREACAKVCEAEGKRADASWVSCAFAIRERGAS